MSIEILPDELLLRVSISGDFSLNESNSIATRIFQHLGQHALQKVLVDFRQVKGEPKVIERFLHAVFIASEMDRFAGAGVSRATRFAYLGTEPMIDRGRFGETVAVNRGINVKVTDSMEEALRWLENEPAAKACAHQRG
jgi:hypothetical protein